MFRWEKPHGQARALHGEAEKPLGSIVTPQHCAIPLGDDVIVAKVCGEVVGPAAAVGAEAGYAEVTKLDDERERRYRRSRGHRLLIT